MGGVCVSLGLVFEDSELVRSNIERFAGLGLPGMETGGEGEPNSARWTGG